MDSKDSAFPDTLTDEAELIDVMTEPSSELVALVPTLPTRVVVLGAGGKMGPTLCIRLARAARLAGRELEIVAVSRFSDESARRSLERHGIRIHVADLLEARSYEPLPDAELVYYLVGQKFGTSSAPYKTWSTNTVVPTFVCRRYAAGPGGRRTRIVALSTGNVYGMTTPASGGSVETDALHPVGEYAASCVGRERVFEHFSATGDVDALLVRLNYAIDLRYGVLVDMAQRIIAGSPIDMSTGYFNCIWQGDANDIILRSASLRPVAGEALNVTGQQALNVRIVASDLAEKLGSVMPIRPLRFVGTEQPTALLSNPAKMIAAFGEPIVPLHRMIDWTVDWLNRGGVVWSKPTHFETRDGKY